MAMRCAERVGMGTMLWKHEFYMVMEPQYGAYVYQALEFQVGTSLPADEVKGSSTKVKKEVWVCGVAYAPALHVRKFNTKEQSKGYLFHTNFDDGDGDKALFGKCPEVVRVDNCTAWRPMSSVLATIPRVIHADDVKTRVIHVAGREMHFVCGVAGMEGVGKFTFTKIPRSHFYMYPEEVLGYSVQSATIMWEQIEVLFENIRKVMRKSGSARSGSLSMPWTASCMSFLEVLSYVVHVSVCN
jgi:hypothetical protein